MDKKGQTDVVPRFIWIIIGFVAILLVLFLLKPVILDYVYNNTCFISVVLKTYSQPTIPTFGLIPGSPIPSFNSPVDLFCKMRNKEINKENAKKVIAKEMANCWERFGEGKFDFYSKNIFDSWYENNNICYVCSRIKSDKEVKVSSSEMLIYLRDKKARPLIEDKTYLQYITGTGLQEGEFAKGIDKDFIINDENSLFILFTINKKEKIEERFERFGVTSVVVGLMYVLGGVVGATVPPVGAAAVIALSAGGANAIFQDKGFNAIVMATDSKGVIDLCSNDLTSKQKKGYEAACYGQHKYGGKLVQDSSSPSGYRCIPNPSPTTIKEAPKGVSSPPDILKNRCNTNYFKYKKPGIRYDTKYEKWRCVETIGE